MHTSARRNFCLAIAVVAGSSCHDVAAPGPIPVPQAAAMLVAVTDTTVNGVAGEAGPPLSVKVVSSDGKPVQGAVVRFSVTPFGGLKSQSDRTSSSDGVAVLKTWTLGPKVGLTLITASAGALNGPTFRATGVAGKPAVMFKTRGDRQMTGPGESVAVAPAVTVADTYGNVTPGVSVTFVAAAGQGALTGAVAVSDSNGVAAVGSWVPGGSGQHTISAMSLVPGAVQFTAIVFSPLLPCGEQNLLYVDGSLSSELSAASCTDDTGRRYDVLSPVLPSRGLYSFTLSSADFDTKLDLVDAGGSPIGRAEGTGKSNVVALMSDAAFTIIASSALPGVLGKYSASYKRAPTDAGCEEWFAVRGASTDLVLGPKSCDQTGNRYGDRYQIFLREGKPVVVAVTDLTYSAWYLSLYDGDGIQVAESVVSDGGYVLTATFTPPHDGYYSIRISSDDTFAEYHLDIQ